MNTGRGIAFFGSFVTVLQSALSLSRRSHFREGERILGIEAKQVSGIMLEKGSETYEEKCVS